MTFLSALRRKQPDRAEPKPKRQRLRVLICGGGELGTAVAHRLWRAGLEAMVVERQWPTALCRAISCAFALYDGQIQVEGLSAVRANGALQAEDLIAQRAVPVLVEPSAEMIGRLAPHVIVDARRPRGKPPAWSCSITAPVVALGWSNWVELAAVVEVHPGLSLGAVCSPQAEPGAIMDHPASGQNVRLVYAPTQGPFRAKVAIGDLVESGAILGWAGKKVVAAPSAGFVRGLIADGVDVRERQPIAELYTGPEREACLRISPWARAVAGGALEAILSLAAGES